MLDKVRCTTICTTTVRVRDLSILADVGINAEEAGARQPLNICVDLLVGAGSINFIEETVDYRDIVAIAEDLASSHIALIETFARRLCMRCLDLSEALEARVSIDKPFALNRGLAGVEVTMRRVDRGEVRQAVAGL